MVLETYKLINTVKKMYPVTQFFKDRYFPDGKVYYSEKALIETKKGNRRVAPFVIPVVGGIVMDSEGYRVDEVRAPYIAPKMPITAEELERKAFGESPESGRSPQQRENEIQAEHMDDMRNAILRRHELMCTDIITTGKVMMKHFASADDAAKDVNYKVMILQFYDEKFQNKYKLTKSFTEMTAREKVLELYKMASVLRKRGVRATDMVMTADVSMLLMSDPEFLDFYNKLRVNTGEINQEILPDGVTKNGTINVNGVVFTLYTYDEVYEDVDGKEKEFLPKGTIALLHPGLGTTVYAQVTFVKGGSFQSYAEKIVPRVVASEGNNIVEVQMFSRPVPYPLDWENWLVANIYDEVGEESLTSNEESVAVYSDESDVELKSQEEIEKMSTKAELIAYGTAIGLDGLDSSMKLEALKAAVVEYQDKTYGD